MRLEYKILWFDDQPDNIRGMVDGIRSRLARDGFKLVVELHARVENPDNFFTDIQSRQDIDLVLMDLQMGVGQDSGAVLAKKIRNKIYTEIVFYSSEPANKLRKIISDEGVDGVYCVNRDSLVFGTMNVIKTTIKKILDINNIRGLVMGVVSEFDVQMEHIILLLAEKTNTHQDILTSIQEKISTTNKSNEKKVSNIVENGDLQQLITYRACTAHHKYTTLCNLLKKGTENNQITSLLETLLGYSDEILKKRNILAHAKITNQNGSATIEGSDESLEEDALRMLRLDMLKHTDNFDDIKAAVESDIFTNNI